MAEKPTEKQLDLAAKIRAQESWEKVLRVSRYMAQTLVGIMESEGIKLIADGITLAQLTSARVAIALGREVLLKDQEARIKQLASLYEACLRAEIQSAQADNTEIRELLAVADFSAPEINIIMEGLLGEPRT